MAIFKCKTCGKDFNARESDRKRGWAKFCSKVCKAKEQARRSVKYSLPDDEVDYEQGWDAHKDSI